VQDSTTPIIVDVAPAWAEIIRLMEEDPDILFQIEPSELNLSTTLPAG
jgi:hypothetical protein